MKRGALSASKRHLEEPNCIGAWLLAHPRGRVLTTLVPCSLARAWATNCYGGPVKQGRRARAGFGLRLNDFQQTVQTALVDGHVGRIPYLGFGVVGHGQARSPHHGQVVGAIAHRNHLAR